MLKQIRPAIVMIIALTIITGLAYPLGMTGLAQALFPRQAAGSLIEKDGKIIGSSLIGQNFTEPKYFWGRLSNSGTFPYNGGASGGSNFGPLNPGLVDAAKAREEALRAADPGAGREIPLDLLTSSGSGLDPHISPAAAAYQVARVAKVRGVSVEQIRALVKVQTEAPQWGLFGEPRVNVLKLNLALDALSKT